MNLEDLKKLREKREKDMLLRDGKARGESCRQHGNERHRRRRPADHEAFLEEIERRGLKDVIVTQSGERGLSSKEPIVTISVEGKPSVVYGDVSADIARKIVAEHLVNGNPVSDYVIETQK